MENFLKRVCKKKLFNNRKYRFIDLNENFYQVSRNYIQQYVYDPNRKARFPY
jgi:ribosomal protein L2